ncbi:hypothetical protein NDI45_27630 [Leptolyngbya sp. GB1-A1]|uniref:hypothetical protein n=1 Tax=Leptolyngbya sp. GB1-A1 TaxID=2933908 RepID=UPI003297B795
MTFYQLTGEEWLTVLRQLKPAEIAVLYYLRTLDPFAEGQLDLKVIDIAAVELSKGTVSKALRSLHDKGFIDATSYVNFRQQDNPEQQVHDRLHQELGGPVKVKTATGRIDLLTDTELIEVKHINDWESALGQVLAYSGFYPEHRKQIHLFGTADPLKLIAIRSTCSDLGVVVTTEEDG